MRVLFNDNKMVTNISGIPLNKGYTRFESYEESKRNNGAVALSNYIFYTELDFINTFFLMKNTVQPIEAYASIIILFLSGVKPRTTASSSKP